MKNGLRPAGPEHKHWTTAGSGNAFGYWRETVGQAFTALSPERLNDDPFHGQIRLIPLCGDASVSAIKSSAQVVRRTKSDIARRPCDAVFVNFQITGKSVVSQRGIESRVPAGSLVVMDATQPFAMKFGAPFDQICLHVPTPVMEANGMRSCDALGRVVTDKSGFAAPMFSAMRELLHGDPRHEAGTLTAILQMLAMGVTDARLSAVADQHLAHIQNFIRGNAGAPELSPAAVAGHFRISVRHLHKLFARSGRTFGRFLLDARLDRCRHKIDADRELPISQIALENGFASQSHFSRAFRNRYGVAPSSLRSTKH